MALTSAINGALSGLQAFARSSQSISSNIANATTPGYGQRSVVLASSGTGPGVSIAGIARGTDPVILAARRTSEAQFGDAEVLSGFQAALLDAVGSPDDASSISGRLAAFESSLIQAASAPDAPARLNTVAVAAIDLSDALNRAAEAISDARSAADVSIGRQVDRLNGALQEVQELNTLIATSEARGVETAGLFDQRQLLIDEINAMVPVREVARPNGQVALFAENGAILLDGSPVEFGFTASNTVTPYQTLASATLSGLTMNGDAVETDSDLSPLRGGTLIAQFEVRDEAGIMAQSQIDSVARDLISRFQDPALDPSLGAGDAGLFTDDGAAFNTADEVGISNRIVINALVDPAQTAETWRLRTGLGAATPGPVGDATLLNAMRDVLNDPRVPASGDFGPGALTSRSLMSHLSSWVGAANDTAEQRLSFLSVSYNEMVEAELAAGVDTDTELQNLLVVENAYAANARVLQAVDEMMQEILRIG